MGQSIIELVALARRIYTNKEAIESVASELSMESKALQSELKTVFPTLISEEAWDIPAVIENLGGSNLPIEMRKEVQKLVKKHGLTKAVSLTNVSTGSAARWGRGELGSERVLKMDSLPWKSLLTGASASAPRETNLGKPHPSEAQRRSAVYRLITERPELSKLAEELNTSVSALYRWRNELVGNSRTNAFPANCEAFIADYAAGTGEDPKPLAEMRVHHVENKPTEKRRQFSTAFKRSAVNRFENQNEPMDALARELNVTDASIYLWRRQILGPPRSKDFSSNARALARDFIEQAQADDVVTHANEREVQPRSHAPQPRSYAPQPYSRAPGPPEVPYSPAPIVETTATVVSDQPNAILASLDAIDRQLVSLQKDRQLLVQQLEIQKLRRALSQHD